MDRHPIRSWRARQHLADEQAVINAIGMLRPSRAGGYPIFRLAHLNAGRTYATLWRLEDAGRVISEWSAGPKPRRRVYRVVNAGGGGDG